MYVKKEVYIVDFANVKYYVQMHEAIQEGLCFPDYYGCNWDAFWDCMTDICFDKLNIEFRNADVIKKLFPDALDKMVGLLSVFVHRYKSDFPQGISIKIQDGDNVYFIE